MKIFWRKIRWWLLGLFLLGNIFVWYQTATSGVKDYLTLAVLDVGQGDAIFIEDVVGHQILIDGGPGSAILAALPKVMPFDDRSLDLLILTHPHADHLDGLVEVLKRYEIGAVLESGALYSSAVYDEWHRRLREKNITVIPARRGERVVLADGAELAILAPLADWRGGPETKNIHNSMIVSRLTQANIGVALLAGDAEEAAENQLLAADDDLRAAILKVGHHGSKTSTATAFVRAVGPKVAVISVGAKNRYGHPHPTTLATLKALGVETLRTDEEGTIVFTIGATGLDRRTAR